MLQLGNQDATLSIKIGPHGAKMRQYPLKLDHMELKCDNTIMLQCDNIH